MIKIMLIAGKSTDELASFLEQRGTFKADFKFTNLAENGEQLLNSIIKVDKFVYVYRVNREIEQADTNIRLDMQMLQRMLTDNSFFKADEFVFLSGNSTADSQAKKFFTSVMSGCSIKTFSTQTMDDLGSYASVYDSLIGITETRDFSNQYRKLYRRSKEDDAVTAYQPKDDRQTLIEPFDYNNLQAFDERIAQAEHLESHEPISDGDDVAHTSLTSPNFGAIADDGLLPKNDFILVAGERKTGKATWALQLAASAAAQNRRVLVIDCTASQHCTSLASDNGLPFGALSPIDVLRDSSSTGNVICQFHYDASMPTFMQHVCDKPIASYDTVIVVMDNSKVPRIADMLCKSFTHVIELTFPFSDDVHRASVMFSGFSGKLFVPMCIYFDESFGGSLTMKATKALMPNATIIQAYRFDGFSNEWLYKKIVRR